MIRVMFYGNDARGGFSVTGHSGYAEEGQDIVCAAVSALTQAACIGLVQIAELHVDHKQEKRRVNMQSAKQHKRNETTAGRSNSKNPLFWGCSRLRPSIRSLLNSYRRRSKYVYYGLAVIRP